MYVCSLQFTNDLRQRQLYFEALLQRRRRVHKEWQGTPISAALQLPTGHALAHVRDYAGMVLARFHTVHAFVHAVDANFDGQLSVVEVAAQMQRMQDIPADIADMNAQFLVRAPAS